MSQQANIEYIEHSWNPIVMRCTKVSKGCEFCWHLRMADRHAANPGLSAAMRAARGGTGPFYLDEEELTAPLRRKKPTRYAVQFMGDLFHESITFPKIATVFGVMDACESTWRKAGEEPHGHTFLLLTKRIRRAAEFYEWVTEKAKAYAPLGPRWTKEASVCSIIARSTISNQSFAVPFSLASGKWPPPNVWLGVSVENQQAADERIPHLLKCPAAVRWISAEPLLGSVELRLKGPDDWDGPGSNVRLDWVVAGGEAGHGARPMHPEWARFLRDQCQAAGVPFFFKQWGEWSPTGPLDGTQCVVDYDGRCCDGSAKALRLLDNAKPLRGGQWMYRVGKKSARLLDGREWNEMPEVRS